MALKLEDIQGTVVGIVKTVAPFPALNFTAPDTLAAHFFADDGTMRDAIEASLKNVGWAIVVSPPIGAATKSQVSAQHESSANHGMAKFDALTVVQLRTDPKSNTGPNTLYPNRPAMLPVVQTITAIIKGVLSWNPGPGEQGFSLITERPFEPDFEDVGCFTYDIRFLKTVSI